MRFSSGDWYLLIFSGFWGLAMGAFPSSVQIGECVCVCVCVSASDVNHVNECARGRPVCCLRAAV